MMFWLFSILMGLSMANGESAKDLYFSGVKAYQSQEYTKAREDFQKALTLEPNNANILYNWGLAEMQLENPGLAIAAWRKALHISPRFQSAQEALDFALSKVQTLPSGTSTNTWNNFVTRLVKKTSINLFLAVNLIFLLVSSLLLLRYWSRRKTALDEETPLPPPPYKGVVTFLLLTLTLYLSVEKYLYDSQTRATVISDSVSMYTGPSVENSSLFEIFAGYEVIVRNSVNDWAQVQIPGGTIGWVPQKTLFFTQETK